jgi:hypothetical protein
MNLDDAVKTHAAWKIKLRGAIDRKAALDSGAIAVDRTCELGRWLHGDGRSQWRSLPEFAKAVQDHEAFHEEAAQVARLINAQD